MENSLGPSTNPNVLKVGFFTTSCRIADNLIADNCVYEDYLKVFPQQRWPEFCLFVFGKQSNTLKVSSCIVSSINFMQFVFIGVLWGGERGKVKFVIHLLTIQGQESMKRLDVGSSVFSPSGQAAFSAACVFLSKCLDTDLHCFEVSING